MYKRQIYYYLGCRKPCLRLWISSLTDRAIREGLDNLKPGSDYDNLYRCLLYTSSLPPLGGTGACYVHLFPKIVLQMLL